MIKEGATESELKKVLAELQEKYADYGRDRRSAIDFHIQQLHRCLQTTQTTRTILWLINCSKIFYNNDGTLKDLSSTNSTNDPNTSNINQEQQNEFHSLWLSLHKVINPTQLQAKQLVDLHTTQLSNNNNSTSIITNNLNQLTHNDNITNEFDSDITIESEIMLNRLAELVSAKNESLDNEMREIQSILSGNQIAKFILWIDENPAVMQILDNLWSLTQTNVDEPSK